MIAAAERLAATVPGLENLSRWTHMLGFRGHFSTKSRRYSTTLGTLRHARAEYRRRTSLEAREPPYDPDSEDTTLVVGEWTFAGIGYTNTGDAVLAAAAAARARERRQLAALECV